MAQRQELVLGAIGGSERSPLLLLLKDPRTQELPLPPFCACFYASSAEGQFMARYSD